MFSKLNGLDKTIIETKIQYSEELNRIIDILFESTFELLDNIGFMKSHSYDNNYHFILNDVQTSSKPEVKIEHHKHNNSFYISWNSYDLKQYWNSFSSDYENQIKILNDDISQEYMKYKPFARLMKLKRIIDE